mmetsp:Transcript_95268/g.164412  ORF Transcript_95268/g.164412 Transcript_95268/m.164412 type:complete len:82 (-) Transcript_95268:62-307(-)
MHLYTHHSAKKRLAKASLKAIITVVGMMLLVSIFSEQRTGRGTDGGGFLHITILEPCAVNDISCSSAFMRITTPTHHWGCK